MFPTATTKAARTFTNKDLDINQLPEGLTPAPDDNSQLPDGLTPVPEDDLSYKGPGLNPAADYLRADKKDPYTGSPHRLPAKGPDDISMKENIWNELNRPHLDLSTPAGKLADYTTDPNNTFFKPTGKGDWRDKLAQVEAMSRGFAGGAIKGAGDLGTGFSSDLGMLSMLPGEGPLGAVPKLAGAAFAANAGKTLIDPKSTTEQRLEAIPQMAGGILPFAHGVHTPNLEAVGDKVAAEAPAGPTQSNLRFDYPDAHQPSFFDEKPGWTGNAKQLNMTDLVHPEPNNQGALNLEPPNPKFSDKWTNSELFPSGQRGGLNEVTPEPEPEISTKGSGPVPPAEPKPENITNEDWNGIQPDRGPQYESPTKVTPEAIVDSLPDAKDGVKVSPFPKADDSVLDELIRNKQVNYADPHLEDVPLHNLVGTQDTVDPEIVKHYVNEGDREPLTEVPSENKGRMDDKAPVVIKIGDENVLAGGHHRATADLVNGKDTMQAVVYNADVPPDLLAKFKASLEKDRAGRTYPEDNGPLPDNPATELAETTPEDNPTGEVLPPEEETVVDQTEEPPSVEEPGLAEKATSKLQEIEDAAKQRIKDRGTFSGNRLQAGLPVDDLVDIAKIGAAKIGKGLVNFADWSADMIKDFGDAIKPHLENIFKVARSYHQAAGDINESIDESRPDGDHVKQIEELLQKRNGQSGTGGNTNSNTESTNPESEVAGTSQNGIQSNAGPRRTGAELTQEFNRPLNGSKTTNAASESEAAQAHPAESQSPQVIKQIKQSIPPDEIPNRISNISNHLDEALKSKKMSPEDKENIVTKALNFQRTLLSSMNLHAPGRQGLPLIWHPSWFKAWVPMVKSYGSEVAYKLAMSAIENDPSGFFKKQPIVNMDGSISKRPPVSFADRAGLDLTDIESHREEIFRSQIAQKYIPLVGRSTRAYTAYLNKLRADVFSDLVKKAGAENDLVQAKKIADFVNVATGRGNLGGFEPSASAISQIFFSPRKMAADAQMFTRTLNPYYYKSVPPVVRMAQLKSALATAGTGLLLGQLAKQAGATVDDNPDSTDYGKIKFGNTRIDPFAGHQQYVVAAARMLQGKSTSSFTNKTHQLNTGKFGSQTAQDIATRFVSNKLAPVPSMVWNWMGGKEFDGTPFNIKQELLEHTAPLVSQDLYHIWKEDPDIVPASIMSGSAGIGFGVQTYGR